MCSLYKTVTLNFLTFFYFRARCQGVCVPSGSCSCFYKVTKCLGRYAEASRRITRPCLFCQSAAGFLSLGFCLSSHENYRTESVGSQAKFLIVPGVFSAFHAGYVEIQQLVMAFAFHHFLFPWSVFDPHSQISTNLAFIYLMSFANSDCAEL